MGEWEKLIDKWEQSGASWKVLLVGQQDEVAERALVGAICQHGEWCGCGPNGPARLGCGKSSGTWECPQIEINRAIAPPQDELVARDWATIYLQEVDAVALKTNGILWQVMSGISYFAECEGKIIPVYYYLVSKDRWVRIV